MKIFKLKWIAAIVTFAISSGFTSFVSADVKLKLIEGKKFSDYEVTGQSRPRSLVTLEKDLNKLFTRLSDQTLKEDQIMEIDVTNIDLPGIYYYSVGPTNRDLRIIDSNTPFKLNFNYRIKNTNGELVKQGAHKIKGFSDSGTASWRNRNRGTVGYYERSLKKWIKVAIAE